jgi:hypothetical protein
MNGTIEVVDNYTIALSLATEINNHRSDTKDIKDILELTDKILQVKPKRKAKS